MAGKKKDAKGKKGLKLPKDIAGSKIPKEARRKLLDLARHPIVADLLAAGLVALAARLKKEPKVKQAAADLGDAAAEGAEKVEETGEDIAQAAAEIAIAVAKPVVKRVRKAVASPPPAPARAAAKPDGAAKTSSKPRAEGAAPAKPRAARRPTPKKPQPPKAPAPSE
ncbi:MAG: hypothetical protein J7500_12460 [Sphingomonas sp.]|nr:hypothetical protein [Sphingomonas sp.]